MEFLNRIRARRGERRVEAWLESKGFCFLQGDQSIANQAGAAFRSDLNNELQAIVRGSDGTSAPGTTYPYQIWNDTTNNVRKQRNAANSGWIVRGTLAETRTFARTSNTILGLADFGCFFDATSGGFTQTLTAAATLGDGWMCYYKVASGHTVTFDPNGAETIDGAATKAVVGPQSGIIFCTGSAFKTEGFIATTQSLPRMFISGLTYANNGTDATNDIDVAAGTCRDATNAADITLVALTKRLDVNWVVGTNQGGLDTGSVGNSDYYLWAIKRSDTGVTDALFSLSSTAPTMPANYDFKRLIGWFKRVSAAILTFTTYELEGGGIELLWGAPTLDINLASTLTTARRTDPVKVPLNFATEAHLNVVITDAAANSITWIGCPDQTDAAPSLTAAPLANIYNPTASASITQEMHIRTSAAGLIAARSTVATVDLYAVSTMGFQWSRR